MPCKAHNRDDHGPSCDRIEEEQRIERGEVSTMNTTRGEVTMWKQARQIETGDCLATPSGVRPVTNVTRDGSRFILHFENADGYFLRTYATDGLYVHTTQEEK